MSIWSYLMKRIQPCSMRLGCRVFILLFASSLSGLALSADNSRIKLEQLEAELQQLKTNYETLSDSVESEGPDINFSGFISFRGGKTSSEYDYAINFNNVVPLESDWNLSNGTVFGVQAVYNLNDKLSSQVQFISRGKKDFNVNLELGFVEYKHSESSSIRFGVLRPPIYRLSEYLDVGYAYPWVTSPVEMYGIFPYSSYQGVDYRYWFSSGMWDFRVNPYVGYSDGEERLSSPKGFFAGMDFQASYENFIFRIGISDGVLKFNDGPVEKNTDILINGTNLFPDFVPPEVNARLPGLLELIDFASGALEVEANIAKAQGDLAKFQSLMQEAGSLQGQKSNYPRIKQSEEDNSSARAQFLSAGVSYDNGTWQVMSEISQARVKGYVSDFLSSYISIGRRFGNVMPYFRYGKNSVTDKEDRPSYQFVNFTNPENISASQNVFPNQTKTVGEIYTESMIGAKALVTGLRDVSNALNTQQENFTIGIRWDVLSSVAIKVEAQRVGNFDGTPGFFGPELGTITPDTTTEDFADDHEYVYQFSIDSVF